MSMSIKTKIQHDLKDAMKARDRLRLGVLRVLVSELDQAEAIPVDTKNRPKAIEAMPIGKLNEAPRRKLTPGDIQAILIRERDERLSASKTYADMGRADSAETLKAEAQIISNYID